MQYSLYNNNDNIDGKFLMEGNNLISAGLELRRQIFWIFLLKRVWSESLTNWATKSNVEWKKLNELTLSTLDWLHFIHLISLICFMFICPFVCLSVWSFVLLNSMTNLLLFSKTFCFLWPGALLLCHDWLAVNLTWCPVLNCAMIGCRFDLELCSCGCQFWNAFTFVVPHWQPNIIRSTMILESSYVHLMRSWSTKPKTCLTKEAFPNWLLD